MLGGYGADGLTRVELRCEARVFWRRRRSGVPRCRRSRRSRTSSRAPNDRRPRSADTVVFVALDVDGCVRGNEIGGYPGIAIPRCPVEWRRAVLTAGINRPASGQHRPERDHFRYPVPRSPALQDRPRTALKRGSDPRPTTASSPSRRPPRPRPQAATPASFAP